MEELNVRTNEMDELEPVNEAEQVSENSNAGAFVAGLVGGFLAYAAICGAKRLKAFISEKRAAKKDAEIVDAERVEEADSDEERSDS